VVPRGGIFLGKWCSSFAGSSDGKMNVPSACALNTRYKAMTSSFHIPSSSLLTNHFINRSFITSAIETVKQRK
jgi:hypothetical protein